MSLILIQKLERHKNKLNRMEHSNDFVKLKTQLTSSGCLSKLKLFKYSMKGKKTTNHSSDEVFSLYSEIFWSLFLFLPHFSANSRPSAESIQEFCNKDKKDKLKCFSCFKANFKCKFPVFTKHIFKR